MGENEEIFNHHKDFAKYYPAFEQSRPDIDWVDLATELDLSRLNWDKNKYDFEFQSPYAMLSLKLPETHLFFHETDTIHFHSPFLIDCKQVAVGICSGQCYPIKKENGSIDTSKQNESLYQSCEERKRFDISLKEYFELKVDEITSDTLRSKDLLDQILVIYTIKRAQCGDERAINRLYSLYENVAIAKARKLWKKRREPINNIDEVEQSAKIILRLLISGDRVKNIDKFWSEGKDDKSLNVLLLNTRKLKKNLIQIAAINNFILDKMLKQQSNKIKQKINKIVKKFKSGELPKERALRELTLLRPKIEAIQSFCIDSRNPYTYPLSFSEGLKELKVTQFNPDVFHPTKNTTFTTWLFGDGKKWRGMFWQRLSDWHSSYKNAKKKEKAKLILDKPIGDGENTLKDMQEAPDEPSYVNTKKLMNLLRKKGFSSRDRKILRLRYINKLIPKEISKKIPLSARQIRRICNKFTSIPKTVPQNPYN